MDTIKQRLRIEFLHAKVELCQIACEALEREYRELDRTREERDDIARRWGAALKAGNAAQIELDRLEKGSMLDVVSK